MKSRIALLLLVFVVAAACFVEVAVFAQSGPAYDGKWKLNEKQSNKPEEEFRRAAKEQQAMNERKGKHRGGEDNDRDEGERRTSGGEKKDKKGKDASGPFRPEKEMTVRFESPDMKVADQTGAQHVYHTNGQKSEWQTADGRNVAYWAHWEDGDLVIEGDTRAGRITETWSLSTDGKQLNRKLRVQTPFLERPVYIVYVYDREGGEAKPSQTQSAPAAPQTRPTP